MEVKMEISITNDQGETEFISYKGQGYILAVDNGSNLTVEHVGAVNYATMAKCFVENECFAPLADKILCEYMAKQAMADRNFMTKTLRKINKKKRLLPWRRKRTIMEAQADENK